MPLFHIRLKKYPASVFHPVHCMLDDRIPFLEWFVIPYFLWHVCILGIHIWLYRSQHPFFFQYSRYLIISMSISTAIFLLYPTCQNLRPRTFPRDNLLTAAVGLLYRMDTNTNVCPSEHVIGAFGFFLAVYYSAGKAVTKTAAGILAFLTAVSTVFLKQHSAIDVIAAVPVCLFSWLFSFHEKRAESL